MTLDDKTDRWIGIAEVMRILSVSKQRVYQLGDRIENRTEVGPDGRQYWQWSEASARTFHERKVRDARARAALGKTRNARRNARRAALRAQIKALRAEVSRT